MIPSIRVSFDLHAKLRIVRYGLAFILLCITGENRGYAESQSGQLRVAAFEVDVTPPLGSPLCDGAVEPAREIVDPLTARGIILSGNGGPIVLCAVDWVGIGNGGFDIWRQRIAEAVGTDVERVAVHCLHQHDAPGCDFDAEELLQQAGLSGAEFHVAFARKAIGNVADAAQVALQELRPITHIGWGKARVDRVASNRRVLGPDGMVKYIRWSATRDAEARAQPTGVIDPCVRVLAFFDGEEPIAGLTYYATHPQSYYGNGQVSWDFVGIARAMREAMLPNVAHIHFNGAAGNVTAGKFNDGSPVNRPVLAQRLATGMSQAWDAMERMPITAADVRWRVEPVHLPLSDPLNDVEALRDTLMDDSRDSNTRIRAARDLVWAMRSKSKSSIDVTCLRIGNAYILHLPGELFVEYQLAAQGMRPNSFVCMAAYGDYGPGYIGTEVAYGQGGYETGPVSRVAPAVERILLQAMEKLLQ